jgi:RimJ/RimL family protein N-acetyltransferase
VVSETFGPKPVVLEGAHVRLEPLDARHAQELFETGHFEDLWTYMPQPMPKTLEETRAWIDAAWLRVEREGGAPFAIVHLATGRAVGSTRYLYVQPRDRGLEIGWTWITPACQRTVVNTESKYLLFKHAFEDLGAIRVQLKTDLRNTRSQRAIERLGAVREGVLRNHMITYTGHRRHSVYYSVIAEEWAAVKARLEGFLRSRENLNT